MGDARAKASIDYERLAEYLRALSVANRLELLRKLQVPMAVSEIKLAPSREDRERAPDRPISRQAIEKHLDRLQELGLVNARAATRGGIPATEFTTNHARLFVVLDELRRLSLVRSGIETESRGTDPTTVREVSPPEIPPGPALVLASGPLEGTVFPLEGPGPWVIGRERGASVILPYDPFVSKENSRLTRERGGALLIEDVPGSRNGTLVNWRRLAEGERAPLVGGDAIGVGRSLLFLRERRG